MERVNYETVLPLVMKQIKQGAFLTALAGDNLNVMTIGWASLGFIWGKSIMTIAVRPTRHTFGIHRTRYRFHGVRSSQRHGQGAGILWHKFGQGRE